MSSKCRTYFFEIASLVSAIPFVVFTLRPYPNFVIPVVIACSLCCFLFALYSRSAFYFIFASSLCVLPIFMQGALNLCIIGLLLGAYVREIKGGAEIKRKGSTYLGLGFTVLIVTLMGSSFKTFNLSLDSLLYSGIYKHYGVDGLHSYFIRNYEACLNAVGIVLGYFLAYLISREFSRSDNPQACKPFLNGLLVGAWLATAILGLQLLDVHYLVNFSQFPAFKAAGRYAASFSDPNSFGIMAFILIAIFASTGRWYTWLTMAVLLWAVQWSGSRSFYLGICLWITILAGNWVKNKGISMKLVIVGVLSLLIVLIIAGEPTVNNKLKRILPAPAISRSLESINWDNAAKMYKSRAIYTRLSLAAFMDSPIIGIGLSRFFVTQLSYARQLNIAMKGWRDNANNFYLSVLVEQGIMGLGGLLLFIVMLSKGIHENKNKGQSLFPRSILASFLLLLFVGPHVFFDEVRYLTSCLIGIAVGNGGKDVTGLRYSRSFILIMLVVFSSYALMAFSGFNRAIDRGVYSEEKVKGGRFIWTGPVAKLHVCRTGDLPFRVAYPQAERDGVRISFYVEKKCKIGECKGMEWRLFKKRELRDNDWHLVRLESEIHPTKYRVETSKIWRPLDSKKSDDARVLGAQLSVTSVLCRSNSLMR